MWISTYILNNILQYLVVCIIISVNLAWNANYHRTESWSLRNSYFVNLTSQIFTNYQKIIIKYKYIISLLSKLEIKALNSSIFYIFNLFLSTISSCTRMNEA